MTSRCFSLPAGGRTLSLPCFFPSISSVKTNLRPLEYLKLLVALDYSLFLISAYDISNASETEQVEMEQLLCQAIQRNAIVLLDSGNYEKYWFRDTTWTLDRYHKVLSKFSFTFSFCYDNQAPPETFEAIARDVEAAVERDAPYASYGGIVPIVHGPPELLPKAVAQVAYRVQPLFIAVPERALGNGVVARAETVFRIRKALDNLGNYYPLHLLGTGNPLSILIYTACGADSFDGLEWCQTVIDYDGARPYHFHQWDFFSHQSGLCLKSISYASAVLTHNLLFYGHWMERVSDAICSGTSQELLSKYLPPDGLNQLRDRFPEVF